MLVSWRCALLKRFRQTDSRLNPDIPLNGPAYELFSRARRHPSVHVSVRIGIKVSEEQSSLAVAKRGLSRAFSLLAGRDPAVSRSIAKIDHEPDAVLLDWMLPRISGLEVCRQIRRAPAWRGLPVIMLTARGEEGNRVRGSTAAPTIMR